MALTHPRVLRCVLVAATLAPAFAGVAVASVANGEACPGSASDGAVVVTATDACLDCHAGAGPHLGRHRVQVDYDAVRQARTRGVLRPARDVVAAGVSLPDGRLECVTCHAARSTWKYRLAVPMNGATEPVVRLGGASVLDTKPLCLACHQLE
jgi:hypothetical protein